MYQVEFERDIAAFINRLEKFDKDVSKDLKKQLRLGANDVAYNARARVASVGVPLSNWAKSWQEQDRDAGRQINYDAARASKQIKVRNYRVRAKGRVTAFGVQVVNMDPAASIFELAGSKNPTSRSGRGGSYTFNQNLINRFGKDRYPRILYPSYYAGIKSARRAIENAVMDAARKVGL